MAGRRGQGGEETGLLPYTLAERLGLPILADVVAIASAGDPSVARLDQALTKGAKRRVTMRLPALVTVHPLAPPPFPFAFGKARRGMIRRHEGLSIPRTPSAFEQRARRVRPKLMRQAGPSSGGGDSVVVDPDPDEAARMILDHLERIGIRSFTRRSP